MDKEIVNMANSLSSIADSLRYINDRLQAQWEQQNPEVVSEDNAEPEKPKAASKKKKKSKKKASKKQDQEDDSGKGVIMKRLEALYKQDQNAPFALFEKFGVSGLSEVADKDIEAFSKALTKVERHGTEELTETEDENEDATREDVKTALIKLQTAAGSPTAPRQLLKDYGATSLNELDENEYLAVIQEAQEMAQKLEAESEEDED